jgi:hypothetical protein
MQVRMTAIWSSVKNKMAALAAPIGSLSAFTAAFFAGKADRSSQQQQKLQSQILDVLHGQTELSRDLREDTNAQRAMTRELLDEAKHENCDRWSQQYYAVWQKVHAEMYDSRYDTSLSHVKRRELLQYVNFLGKHTRALRRISVHEAVDEVGYRVNTALAHPFVIDQLLLNGESRFPTFLHEARLLVDAQIASKTSLAHYHEAKDFFDNFTTSSAECQRQLRVAEARRTTGDKPTTTYELRCPFSKAVLKSLQST